MLWSLLFSVLFNAETQGYLGCTEKFPFKKEALVVANTLQCLKRDPGLSFGTFQAGCIGLYWAGYVGVKVPNESHDGSLFKHQRVF